MGYYPELRELLDKRLSELDMSGSQIARRLQVSPSTVTRWCNGQARPRTPDMVIRVADVLSLHGEERDALLRVAGYAPSVATVDSENEPDASVDETHRAAETASPSLLPNPSYQQLINRREIFEIALDALHDNTRSWIIGIDGIGGIGKTAVVRAIVQACQERQYFESYLWVSANTSLITNASADNHFTYEKILNTVLYQFELPELTTLALQEKEQRVFLLLRQQRALIVLDSLETTQADQEFLIAQLSPLLNPSKVICISRHRFQGDLLPIHLGGLDLEATTQLIRQEAQARRVAQLENLSEQQAAEFVKVSGGSPLVTKLAVGQASHLPFAAIVEQVHTAGVPRINESYYHKIYLPSWQLLSTDAQKLLIAMALLIPGEGGSLEALFAICDLPQTDVLSAIDELWRLSLLEVASQDIQQQSAEYGAYAYYLHPLTANFVIQNICGWQQKNRSRLVQVEPDPHEGAFDYALYWQQSIERGVHYLENRLADAEEDLPLEPILRLTMRILDYGLELVELWSGTSRLLLKITPKMELAGYSQDWLLYLEKAIILSEQAEDLATQAELELLLGVLHRVLNQLPEAEQRLSNSVSIYQDLADHRNHARALNRLAAVKRLQKEYDDAQTLARQALSLTSEGDPVQASSYYVLGTLAFDAQDWDNAKQYLMLALDLAEDSDDGHMASHALGDLGAVHYHLGKLDEACLYYEKAIARFAELSDRHNQAKYLMNLGIMHLEMYQWHDAMERFVMAQPVFEDFQDIVHLALLYTNQGMMLRGTQQWEKAEQVFTKSLELWRQLGNDWEQSNVFYELGLLYLADDSYKEAKIALGMSLKLAQTELTHPDYQKRIEKVKASLAMIDK